MSEIAVKPIVWGGPESRISEGGILPYWVGGGTKERLYGGQRTASPLGEFATLDEAKAAAQADYERCIRSAINTPAVDTKDAEIARLREALQGLEWACEQLAATRSIEIYTAMIDGGQTDALLSLDARRHAARAALEEKADA